MPWLIGMCAQNISTYVLFDQLTTILARWQRKEQIIKSNPRFDFDDRVSTWPDLRLGGRERRRRYRHGA